MKKKILAAFCTVVATLTAGTVAFAGCGGSNDSANKEYTIQYTDESGTHQITVTGDMPYALDVIPEKSGYTFLGLFDAEVGGTQYVSATGASLTPFKDGKNLVLFPQFKAKDYTVILDYHGAAVTGSRQLTVAYGSSLPELPKNLTVEHKDFVGWYTKANCEGVQVADEYGLIPVVSVLNETNFDLTGEYIYLYAGFQTEKFTVTCCFEAGMDTEDVQVEYDTPVSQIVTKTRVNDEAPLTWSKTQGGEVFNGKVTDDMVLYAVEYAPVIELDSNGGDKINSIVARAGSTIALPTPTKDMAKFAYWEDMQGNRYESTTMPGSSISLKAVWQAKLVFDENGGSDVEDISVAAGEKITLPMPEREGFIFAGWYTAEREQYTSTTMPASGIKLKAGWYKAKSENVVVITATGSSSSKANAASINSACFKLQYDKYSLTNDAINIRLKGHIKISSSWAEKYGAKSAYLEVYSQRTVSSSYLMDRKTFTGVTGDYRPYEFELNLTIEDDIYLCWYHECPYTSWPFYLSDFYYTIDYPDTTNLYL